MKSFPEAARGGAEVVLDVAGEVAEGGEVEEVGDGLNAQAAVAQLSADVEGGIARYPVVVRADLQSGRLE